MRKFIEVTRIVLLILLIAICIVIMTRKSEKIDNVIETSNTKIELFEEYYAEAEYKLKNMTLEEKVSQMFIVRCPNNDADEFVSKNQMGGYILFANDFKGKTRQEVIDMINQFQSKSKIPMIIATDEEGGTVCRVSLNNNLVESKYKSPQELYNEGGLEKIYNDSTEKSKLLLSLGINMNLAPVVDVSTNEADYIYKRSFGKDANQTSEYVKTVVKAMKESNIACSLKHFPGYGDNKDSHKEATYDNRSIEIFENSDFLPFKAGIESGAQSVLVSHNIVKAIDEEYPASLSKKVHDLLREKFEFSGLIITDDLAMSATKKFANVNELAIIAVQAGNDLIITSDFLEQKSAIIDSVKTGKISESRINESVKRIIAYKYYMKLM